MSRSAFVTIRWSKTKLPLSDPATTRSEGSQWRRSGEREDLLERLLARLRRHARGHPQPQRVEVAVERVGLALGRAAAQRAGAFDELSQLGQRVAGAGRRDVERQQHRQLLLRQRHRAVLLAVDDRDRRAPRALARDREVLGLVADGRARLRTRGRLVAGFEAGTPSRASRRERRCARRAPRRCGRPRGCRTRRSRRSGRRRRVRSARVAAPDRRAPALCAECRSAGSRAASRELRSQAARAQLLQPLAHLGLDGPGVDLAGACGRDQHEARLRELARHAA